MLASSHDALKFSRWQHPAVCRGARIAVLVYRVDCTNCRYVYRIRGRSGSRSDWFHVDRRSGLMTTSVTFSCLTVGDYRLNVVARNSTVRPRVVLTTSVTVRVTSVNRHSPVFHAGFYSEDVPDDTAVSTCLLRVSNSVISYHRRHPIRKIIESVNKVGAVSSSLQ